MMPDIIHDRNGLIVGLYFVYATPPNERHVFGNRAYPALDWGIMHWPSKLVICSVFNFGNALVLADEFSIQHSINYTESAVVNQLVPKSLLAWARHAVDCDADDTKPMPYREWRGNSDQQSAS